MTGDQPPGQLLLWRPAPGSPPSTITVVTADYVTRVRGIPFAALRAHALAAAGAEAWLVAPDTSCAHVGADGTVTPSTGWASLASRTISNKEHRNP